MRRIRPIIVAAYFNQVSFESDSSEVGTGFRALICAADCYEEAYESCYGSATTPWMDATTTEAPSAMVSVVPTPAFT